MFRNPNDKQPESNSRITKAHPAKTGAECGTRIYQSQNRTQRNEIRKKGVPPGLKFIRDTQEVSKSPVA